MSTFAVKVCKVSEVLPHENAERLDIIRLEGKDWQIISQKGQWVVNDLCVFFPVDSVLPPEVECKIFPPESKIKLNNSRIRTIKLRGAISQGMIAKPYLFDMFNPKNGTDVTDDLKVTKYEPVVKQSSGTSQNATKKQTNPHFRKYTGIENSKNYNNIFNEGDMVVVTEKLHGTNFRCGWVETNVNTLWKKIKKYFNLLPKYEFVYASHNVQLQDKLLYTGFYDSNVYAEAVVRDNLKEVLKPGEVIYGEIIGSGIQKGYTYGCKEGQRKTVFFEVRKDDRWLDAIEAEKFIKERSLEFVPVLYKGLFNKELVNKLKVGASVYCPEQNIREGCVVRSMVEEQCFIGRKLLKFINEEYLLANQDQESLPH